MQKFRPSPLDPPLSSFPPKKSSCQQAVEGWVFPCPLVQMFPRSSLGRKKKELNETKTEINSALENYRSGRTTIGVHLKSTQEKFSHPGACTEPSCSDEPYKARGNRHIILRRHVPASPCHIPVYKSLCL